MLDKQSLLKERQRVKCTNKDEVNQRINVLMNIQTTTHIDAKITKIDD